MEDDASTAALGTSPNVSHPKLNTSTSKKKTLRMRRELSACQIFMQKHPLLVTAGSYSAADLLLLTSLAAEHNIRETREFKKLTQLYNERQFMETADNPMNGRYRTNKSVADRLRKYYGNLPSVSHSKSKVPPPFGLG